VTSPSSTARRPSVALVEVAQRFWWPVYGEIRDRGLDPAEAARLTGVVLGRLASGSPFVRHDDHEGRLRLLIFAELEFCLGNPDKLSGSVAGAAIDPAVGEARGGYGVAVPGAAGFRGRWAVTVLELALGALRLEAARAGNGGQIDRLVPFLARNVPDWRDMDIAVAVDVTEVNNLRDTFRGHVRRVVSDTVTTPMSLDAELLELFD
jgi:hypothetical protein